MKTTPKKSEYDIQVETFAEAHNLTMTASYLGHFPRFGDYATSQWQITLTRPGHGKPFSFTFSQSINDSWQYRDADAQYTHKLNKGLPPRLNRELYPTTGQEERVGRFTFLPAKVAPSLYDVLACLTKSNPGDFEEFCDAYGFSDDSIKARDTWQAVVSEWRAVERLLGDCLDELQEIN